MVKDEWSEVVVASEDSVKEIESVEITRGKKIEEAIEHLHAAIDSVYEGRFDVSKSDGMAALALSIQIDLSKVLADASWRAKQAKQEVKRISADVHHKYRSMPSEKKITDASLTQVINRDNDVKKAENRLFEIEKELDQWQYYFGTLKDAHIFFRNLNKNGI